MKRCLQVYADSADPSKQGVCSLFTDSLDAVEYIIVGH